MYYKQQPGQKQQFPKNPSNKPQFERSLFVVIRPIEETGEKTETFLWLFRKSTLFMGKIFNMDDWLVVTNNYFDNCKGF